MWNAATKFLAYLNDDSIRPDVGTGTMGFTGSIGPIGPVGPMGPTGLPGLPDVTRYDGILSKRSDILLTISNYSSGRMTIKEIKSIKMDLSSSGPYRQKMADCLSDLLKISKCDEILDGFRVAENFKQWNPIEISPIDRFFKLVGKVSDKRIIPLLIEILINIITQAKHTLNPRFDTPEARYELFYLQIGHHLDDDHCLYLISLMMSNLKSGTSRCDFASAVYFSANYDNSSILIRSSLNSKIQGFLILCRSLFIIRNIPSKKVQRLFEKHGYTDFGMKEVRERDLLNINRKYLRAKICLSRIIPKMILNEILRS